MKNKLIMYYRKEKNNNNSIQQECYLVISKSIAFSKLIASNHPAYPDHAAKLRTQERRLA